MKNSIDARVEFSFKGENYDLTSHIDLDELSPERASCPSLHEVLARDHDIDTISYLYEVMLEAEIEFSNARGIAADFYSEGHFDLAAFASHWQDHQIALLLQPIAKRELKIDDLTRQTSIRNALVQAYKLGRGL